MKQLKIIICLTAAIFFTACSFGYDVVVINDSDTPIEIIYKIGDRGNFDEPLIKSLEDWQTQKSLKRFWTEEKPWQNLHESEYETDFETRERKIKVAPRQIVRIEYGNYNPSSEERGELTDIAELKIVSLNGEISYKGKSLLRQFEKDGYTFVKTHKDAFQETNLK